MTRARDSPLKSGMDLEHPTLSSQVVENHARDSHVLICMLKRASKMSSGPALEGRDLGPGRQRNSSTQEKSQCGKRLCRSTPAPALQDGLLVSMTWACLSFLQSNAGSIPLQNQKPYIYALLKNQGSRGILNVKKQMENEGSLCATQCCLPESSLGYAAAPLVNIRVLLLCAGWVVCLSSAHFPETLHFKFFSAQVMLIKTKSLEQRRQTEVFLQKLVR